jgi:hypothetical protein
MKTLFPGIRLKGTSSGQSIDSSRYSNKFHVTLGTRRAPEIEM